MRVKPGAHVRQRLQTQKPSAPRVGRPPRSAQQSAEVRARVIEVARSLFAAEGFEAVSMRRIAADAGCAAGSAGISS